MHISPKNNLPLLAWLVSAIGVVSVVGGWLFTTVWPMFRTHGWTLLQRTAVACGCEQWLVTPHPWLMTLAFVLLTLLGVVMLTAFGRMVWMIMATRRFQRAIQRTAVRTVWVKRTPIHRVIQTQPMAVCLGWFRPHIYISTGLEKLLTPMELWAVIQHELNHAEQRDPGQRLVMKMIQVFFPWQRQWFIRWQAWQEVTADMAVPDAKQLQRALVKLLSVPQSQLPIAATWFSATDLRIQHLLGDTLSRPRLWPLLWILLCLAVGLGVTQRAVVHTNTIPSLVQCLATQPMCDALMSYD